MTKTIWNEPPEPPDQEKEEALRGFAVKMKKIRESQPGPADIEELKACIERLLDVAESDTGQSRRVANFLLAWWNAGECGGFDFTDLWNVDMEIAEDMVRIFT